MLPGIEGRSIFSRNIVIGLERGGVKSAIELFDWTTGVPGTYLINLVYLDRNKREASKLASRIIEYRRRYPDRPVHIIGHSGGGGVGVLALEALPAGRQIDMAILLAPALSPDYNLATALRRTRYGIQNYYSSLDMGFLGVGTTIFGQIDRDHGPSAGAVGFKLPANLTREDRALYDAKLRQVKWNRSMREKGASGGHFGWADRDFVAQQLARVIIENETRRPPPDPGRARRAPQDGNEATRRSPEPDAVEVERGATRDVQVRPDQSADK